MRNLARTLGGPEGEGGKIDHRFFGGGATAPPMGQGLLIHEVSRSHTHNDAPQSVGILWTSDQLVAETSP